MTSLWRAYARWRSVAGPLADFVLPAPFLAPAAPPGRLPVAPEASGVAEEIRRRAGRDSVVFLEAPPRLGLAVGLRLGRAGWPVAPLFGRWPAHGTILPTDDLTAWLTGVADALAADTRVGVGGVSGVGGVGGVRVEVEAEAADPPFGAAGDGPAPSCLILDAERRRRVDGGALRRRFDNRYDYLPYLLPPPQSLRGWGIAHLLWAGPTAVVPADLQEYAESLVGAGIAVELIRLPAPRRRNGGAPAPGQRAAGRRRGPTALQGKRRCGP